MSSPFRETSLILECPKCETLNYLDPFTFWNFKGKIKCAGCDAIWAYELVNGVRTGPPAAARRRTTRCPDTRRARTGRRFWIPPRSTRAQAREDFQGKPIPISRASGGTPFRDAPEAGRPGREPREGLREVGSA